MPSIMPPVRLRRPGARFEIAPIPQRIGQDRPLYPGPYAAVALRSTVDAVGAGGTGSLSFTQDSDRWFEIGQHMFDRITDFGDLTSLEIESFQLGQFQEYLIGGDSLRFDAISGVHNYASAQFRPFLWNPPLLLSPSNRVMLALRSADAAEMTIAGYLEGRQLVYPEHDYVRNALSQRLFYGRPALISQSQEIPLGESREFRVEASDWGFLVHAVRMFSDSSEHATVFNNENIRIDSIRVHADQEAIYGEAVGRSSIPAEMWAGVTTNLAAHGASPRDVWHYLPYPITVFPRRTMRISVFNRGDTGEQEENIRLVCAGQYLTRG